LLVAAASLILDNPAMVHPPNGSQFRLSGDGGVAYPPVRFRNSSTCDLPGVVSADLRAIKMAVAAMDAPAIKLSGMTARSTASGIRR